MPRDYPVHCINHLDRLATDEVKGYSVCSFCAVKGSLPWWMRSEMSDDAQEG